MQDAWSGGLFTLLALLVSATKEVVILWIRSKYRNGGSQSPHQNGAG